MKYYVVADVHGYYSVMKKALKDAGFFNEKKPHKLVICGDLLDRGKEAKQMVEFAYQLMKEDKLIYILGNHEDLLVRCLQDIAKGNVHKVACGMNNHLRNGTWDTLLQLANMTDIEACNNSQELVRRVMASPFYKELLPSAINYYETTNYVFVHGWIPCYVKGYIPNIKCRFNKNWRSADITEWQRARWYNGMELACKHRMTVAEKTVICGHWHASYGHAVINKKGQEIGSGAINDPFYRKGIIAIDARTAASAQVNCIVIED